MLAPLRDALLSRAPLWLRVQHADRAALYAELHELGWPWQASSRVDDAIELPAGTDITRTRAFAAGAFEVQDVGSQLVLRSAGVTPGGHWLDACAGAGGKTLQLAALLGKAGRITARDVRPAALDELRIRASRAGVADHVAIGDPADPAGGFDGVLIDAPCSGSGTWRRAPHLRWSTTLAGVRDAAALQLKILTENAPRVRRGGVLVYATCSLFRAENEDVVAAFLAVAPEFAGELSQSILPPEPDGDGFFVATLRRAR
jgi:16S rRNA (cytosine967-C5)-methyltransferase